MSSSAMWIEHQLMVCHAIGIDNDRGSVSSNLCDSLVEVEVEVEDTIVALDVDVDSVTATLPVVGTLKGLLLLLLLFDGVTAAISSSANAAAANAAAFASLRLLGVGLVYFSGARSTSNVDLSSGHSCAL